MPTYDDYLNVIKKERQYVDVKEYSHNIISLELRMVAEKFGLAKANAIIQDAKLDELGWQQTGFTDDKKYSSVKQELLGYFYKHQYEYDYYPAYDRHKEYDFDGDWEWCYSKSD